MKPFSRAFLLLTLATLTTQAATPVEHPTHIVMLRDGEKVDDFLAEHGIRARLVYGALNGFAAVLPDAAVEGLKRNPRVAIIEPDGPVTLCMQTNPAGITRIGIPQFPPARVNGTNEPINVDVAVLDSGIDPHPDLNVVHFYSPFTEDPADELGHGTAVAGVLGAMDNDFGVVGAAPGVRLWNIKMIDSTHLAWSYVLSAMSYVIQNSNQISVANMSFTNYTNNAPFLSLRNTVRLMVNAGIVVVAAVGNENRDIVGVDGVFGNGDDALPAALPEAMAVSGMNPTNDTFWIDTPGVQGSNFSQVPRTNVTNHVTSPGGAIDVIAPARVYTTAPFNKGFGTNAYYTATGTSGAAPHVAGLVALYIAANGRATNAAGVYAIRQAIVDAALPQSQWLTNSPGDPDSNPEPLALASEAWIPSPVITQFTGAPGNLAVGFAAVPGYQYTVQSATNLTPPVAWADAAGVIGVSNTLPATVTATNVSEQGYYRLQRTPAP